MPDDPETYIITSGEMYEHCLEMQPGVTMSFNLDMPISGTQLKELTETLAQKRTAPGAVSLQKIEGTIIANCE